MSTVPAVFRLVRPLNLLIIAAGALLGGVLSARGSTLDAVIVTDVLLAAASAVLIAAGANAINDVFDLESDAVNRPDRPLPSGHLSVHVALAIWFAATAGGLILAATVSAVHFVLAIVAAGLLYAYSRRLKAIPFVGNLVVAAVVGLVVVYGGWAAESPVAAYTAGLFAATTTLAREIIKDIEDMSGDRAAGIRTVPLVWGVERARQAAAAVLIGTVLLTPVPYLMMDYGSLFLFLVAFADLLLLRALWLLPDAPAEARGASVWLKGAMVAGIVALFAA